MSEEEQAKIDNAEPSLVGWGFTVYRTYYGPGSDQNWNTLRNKAKEEADKELMACVYDGNDETAEKLKPLFRLDARSDPALLDGLSLAELCKVYKDKAGGEPEPVHECCVFLVADEQILIRSDRETLLSRQWTLIVLHLHKRESLSDREPMGFPGVGT